MAIGIKSLAQGISMQTCWWACLSVSKFIESVVVDAVVVLVVVVVVVPILLLLLLL